MGGKRIYIKKAKYVRYCAECLDEIITNRPGTTHCKKRECQNARNRANLERYILNKAKELQDAKC